MGGLLVAGRPAPARAAGVTPRVFGTPLQSEAAVTDRAFAQTKVALVAAAVGFGVYVVGFIATSSPRPSS